MCRPAFTKSWKARIVAFHSNPATRCFFSFLATARRNEIPEIGKKCSRRLTHYSWKDVTWVDVFYVSSSFPDRCESQQYVIRASLENSKECKEDFFQGFPKIHMNISTVVVVAFPLFSGADWSDTNLWFCTEKHAYFGLFCYTVSLPQNRQK